MQLCPKCRYQVSPLAKFCRSCGFSFVAGQETLLENAKTLVATAKTLVADNSTQAEDNECPGGTLLYDADSLSAKPTHEATSGELLGLTVAGYTITKKLGEGGMGAVYQATHQKGRSIAIKVLHSDFANDPVVVQRFFNEAKAVNQIGNPHIVDISDFGFLHNKQAYMTMEFLEGIDLAGRLQKKSPLFESEAIDIIMQVLDALQATHEAGIIHRDLKPENIFLLKNKKNPARWFVKVLDFGIAKLSQNLAGSQSTVLGTILGTPAYMSPEQARGDKALTYSADIYSLGVILYELLTGRTPFQEHSYLGYLVAHQRRVPPSPREFNSALSEDIESLLLRCLAKKPGERFSSAKEMKAALLECLTRSRSLGIPTRLETPKESQTVAEVKKVEPEKPIEVVSSNEPEKPIDVISMNEPEKELTLQNKKLWWLASIALTLGAFGTVYLLTY